MERGFVNYVTMVILFWNNYRQIFCFVSGLVVPLKDFFNILKLNLAWVFGSLAGLAIFRTFFFNIRELLKQKKVQQRFELVLLDS
jgi:hypothetical protein